MKDSVKFPRTLTVPKQTRSRVNGYGRCERNVKCEREQFFVLIVFTWTWRMAVCKMILIFYFYFFVVVSFHSVVTPACYIVGLPFWLCEYVFVCNWTHLNFFFIRCVFAAKKMKRTTTTTNWNKNNNNYNDNYHEMSSFCVVSSKTSHSAVGNMSLTLVMMFVVWNLFYFYFWYSIFIIASKSFIRFILHSTHSAWHVDGRWTM